MQIILVLLLNAAVLFLYFHYFRWKITSADFLKDIKIQKEEIAQEISAMIIELNKTTERNLQIIEDRINQLKELNRKSEKLVNIFKKNQDDLYNAYLEIEKNSKPEPEAAVVQKQEITADNETVRDKVLKMYQNGIDYELIAGNLGITSGEVEFIISINNAR